MIFLLCRANSRMLKASNTDRRPPHYQHHSRGVSTAQHSTTSSSTISQNRPISNRQKWEEKNFLRSGGPCCRDFHPIDLMCRKMKEEQFVWKRIERQGAETLVNESGKPILLEWGKVVWDPTFLYSGNKPKKSSRSRLAANGNRMQL